jgi:hypothetical protein
MYEQSLKNESATALVPLVDKSEYGVGVQATPELMSNLFMHLSQITGISGKGLLPSDQLLNVKNYTQEQKPEANYLTTKLYLERGGFGASLVFDRYVE